DERADDGGPGRDQVLHRADRAAPARAARGTGRDHRVPAVRRRQLRDQRDPARRRRLHRERGAVMDSGVLRRPLPLAYHPLYRFYEGGALTRAFRGLPERPDDWWSEDWVGSCTCAGNPDPDGRVQGLSTVDLPSGQVTLKSLAEAWPEDMGDASVLVKLLSPSGPVPLHAHPTRAWARQHLRSPF